MTPLRTRLTPRSFLSSFRSSFNIPSLRIELAAHPISVTIYSIGVTKPRLIHPSKLTWKLKHTRLFEKEKTISHQKKQQFLGCLTAVSFRIFVTNGWLSFSTHLQAADLASELWHLKGLDLTLRSVVSPQAAEGVFNRNDKSQFE